MCSLPTEAAGLLGTDFLEKTGAVIDFECAKMSFADVGKVTRVYRVPHAKHSALTVFTGGKVKSSPSSEFRRCSMQANSPQLISVLRKLLNKVGPGLLGLRRILLYCMPTNCSWKDRM